MAGHSKWANIKHKKKAVDAKRGKVFTKLIRKITVAAREGGGDIDANPKLRLAVDEARGSNMKNDTIERAIQRGAGGGDGADLVEIRYEGYGAAGVAVLVECLTDNKNRTVAEVRHAFSKCAGNLGTDGSVAYLFEKKGEIMLAPGADEDQVMEIALDAGADDVVTHDDQSIEVVTTPDAFLAVKTALETANITPDAAEVSMVPSTTVDITDENKAEQIIRLTDMLEDLDDVQDVYMNASIPGELLEKLSS